MIKLDARRLTGINVIWIHAGAVVDVRLERDDNINDVSASWHGFSRRMLDALGWTHHQSIAYPMHSGVALAISAPTDALYAAVEVAEWIYSAVAHEHTEAEAPVDFHTEVERLTNVIHDEANPALRALIDSARVHNATVLCDDDEVSIGLGRYATTWPIGEIPTSPNWANAKDIPIGLVTGTNGKTTTVRLTQRMLRAAGLAVGISSTDWIGVDDTIIDRGDYSGPGGARAVLRQNSVDVAVLETARGGLLRRGLGMPRADAALITNIAEDHLGDFGSENLQELLNLKWIVTQALDNNSIAILNADDALLRDKADSLTVPVHWFSLDSKSALIQNNIEHNRSVTTVKNDRFVRFDGNDWQDLCRVNDAPITVRGSAKHNIANALGAIALAHALGATDTAIIDGLKSMQPNDNPGRCNFFNINGVDVLLDFAHNPSAMEAIFDIAQNHSAKNRFLCFGQAGDRTDQSIIELAQHAWAIGLEHVFISELADHRRGREPKAVFNLLKKGLINAGARDNQISHSEYEQHSLDQALEMAQPGDLIIMLALGEARTILEWLSQQDH